MRSYFTDKPDVLLYMPLPDIGKADAWLRKDIKEADMAAPPGPEGEDNGKLWEADEVYVRTSLSRQQVEERFEEIFEHGGAVAVAAGNTVPGTEPGGAGTGSLPDGEISADEALSIIMGVME